MRDIDEAAVPALVTAAFLVFSSLLLPAVGVALVGAVAVFLVKFLRV